MRHIHDLPGLQPDCIPGNTSSILRAAVFDKIND
jgi:hypothetical protein